MNAPDLTQRPPRSARVRLGGYVILPRMLDKCRAVIAGTQGEYKYACPLDQRFLQFAGIDSEILEWITTHSTTKPTPPEIAAWSTLQENRVPTDLDSRQYFSQLHCQIAPQRMDIGTWFDLLDLDDYVTFGGKP
jgi:hypothetical protein